MATFKYLSNNENCVLKTYTKEELKTKFIIRDEFNKNFIVFQNFSEYINHWNSTPNEQKCFHEIIFGFNNQKIKFDIDIKIPYNDFAKFEEFNSEKSNYKPSEILINEINEIIDTIINQFYILYKINITYEDIIIADSSGVISSNAANTIWKYSYHIIVLNHYVDNNMEAKKFVSDVYNNLSEHLQQYIDLDTNKQIQNFRLLGCSKLEAPRRFKKRAELFFNAQKQDIKYIDFIINKLPDCEGIILPIINKESSIQTNKNIIIPQNYIDFIMNWLETNNIIKDHIFRCVVGDIISFNRIDNTEICRICNRIHDHDHSLFIRIQKIKKNKVSLIEYCHRCPGKYNTLIKDLCITDLDANIENANIENANIENANIENANIENANIENADANIKPPYLQILIDRAKSNLSSVNLIDDPVLITETYCEPYMKPYSIEPNTLCIKAQMGCGKTKALRDYLDHYFTDEIFTQCIRFLTFRQTFAKSLLENFSDFKLYSELTGDIDQDNHSRVIIQVESLHRLVLSKPVESIDLLILDEVESIFAQFNSGLHQHFNSAFAIFQWMLATAKKVICIDANLCERTINILKRMRIGKNDDLQFIHFNYNTYNKESENIYKITNNNSDWISIMMSYLSANKRIVLPTNSLLEAKVYKQIIEEHYPNKRIQLYSSEMLMSDKNEHFSNVSHYWAQLDVLIYTPTCSAGISFELEHFDYVFAHMTDASCDVETCRQMLMRVRNISSKTYYIYFPPYSSNSGNYPTTTENIALALKNKKHEMLKNDAGHLQFEYTNNGDIIFFETNYFHLWLENVRIENLSKNYFVERFIQFSMECGAEVELLTTTNNSAPNIATNYKQTKKDIKGLIANNIALAKNITQEQQLDIQGRMQSHIDVTVEEIQSLEKFYIKESYNIKYEIDANFILIYNNESVKKVFKYLSKICHGRTIEESLSDLQRRDIDAYSIIGEQFKSTQSGIIKSYQEGFEYQNLVKYKYTYTNHNAAQELIKICGFAFVQIFLMEPACISLDLINANIRCRIPCIEKYIIIVESEIKMPKTYSNISTIIKKISNEQNIEEFIKKIIKLINFILSDFYGIEIKKMNNGLYALILGKIGKLFKFVLNDDAYDGGNNMTPNIICNLEM